jgi:hypothetical protein
MPKPSSWYDHCAETSPFLTALAEARLECNRAERVMPHAKVPGSLMLIEAIKKMRQADTASHLEDWANSSGLQPPK